MVIERVYPHIPAIIRLFITANMLANLIDKALKAAKLQWESNPALLAVNPNAPEAE
jgi:hypothetical protein